MSRTLGRSVPINGFRTLRPVGPDPTGESSTTSRANLSWDQDRDRGARTDDGRGPPGEVGLRARREKDRDGGPPSPSPSPDTGHVGRVVSLLTEDGRYDWTGCEGEGDGTTRRDPGSSGGRHRRTV